MILKAKLGLTIPRFIKISLIIKYFLVKKIFFLNKLSLGDPIMDCVTFSLKNSMNHRLDCELTAPSKYKMTAHWAYCTLLVSKLKLVWSFFQTSSFPLQCRKSTLYDLISKCQLHKMVKDTQTIRRNIRRIVWVCLTILQSWRLKG